MAYCRWSTDGFRCDVYAYESTGGGYVIHVATRKKVLPEGWKDPCETHLSDVSSDNAKERFAQYNAVMAEYDALPWRNLEAPSAGKSFHESTPQAFKERMESLRAEGLLFPDDVLDRINRELNNEP